MIHGQGCSYYHEMGLICYHGVLYTGPATKTGLHLAEHILLAMERGNVTRFTDFGVILALVKLKFNTPPRESTPYFHGTVSFMLRGIRNDMHITDSLVIIQRAVRAFVRAKLEDRGTALAMSTHSRLGSASVLGGLCPDLLRMVYQP